MASDTSPPRAAPPTVAELLQGIAGDVRRIAVDEVDLARGQLTDYLGKLILKASGVIVAACVAFIGLGLLCLAAVAALGPVIAALWLRLLLMSVVYLAVGGALTAMFMRRLAALHHPETTVEH